ncbi:MAG: SRPBCC family protein [Hyphomonadaceae bacterium]
MEKAQVSLPNGTEVRVTRDFKAPRKLVWQAHTDPKLVTRWMLGPPGWSMPVCEMDVRPGGKYRWRWRSDEGGQEFGFFGQYLEVDAPACMTHEENYDPGDISGAMDPSTPAIIRTAFIEKNGVTSLEMVMKFATRAIRDAAVSTGMTDGMEMGYERLDTMFAEHQGG